MREFMLIAGLAAAMAAPTFSYAATACQRAGSEHRSARVAGGGPCPSGSARRTVSTRPVAAHCTWRDDSRRDHYGVLVQRQVRVCR